MTGPGRVGSECVCRVGSGPEKVTRVHLWNSLPESVEIRSLASFVRINTVVDLADHLRCFRNMFYSVLGQKLEHFVPFCSSCGSRGGGNLAIPPIRPCSHPVRQSGHKL